MLSKACHADKFQTTDNEGTDEPQTSASDVALVDSSSSGDVQDVLSGDVQDVLSGDVQKDVPSQQVRGPSLDENLPVIDNTCSASVVDPSLDSTLTKASSGRGPPFRYNSVGRTSVGRTASTPLAPCPSLNSTIGVIGERNSSRSSNHSFVSCLSVAESLALTSYLRHSSSHNSVHFEAAKDLQEVQEHGRSCEREQTTLQSRSMPLSNVIEADIPNYQDSSTTYEDSPRGNKTVNERVDIHVEKGSDWLSCLRRKKVHK
jgi:hypothetical protein